MRRTVRKIGQTATIALALAVATSLPPIGGSAVAQVSNPAPIVQPITISVTEASQRFGVPEDWIYAVMRVESAGDPGATSVKGAIGLMQVMPQTYAALRARYGFGPNAYDPRDNILAGTAYLREMYDRYGAPGFLAAYNAGPGRYEGYLSGRPLPTETRAYVTRLAPQVDGAPIGRPIAAPDPLAWTRGSLFAGHGGDTEIAAKPVAAPTSDVPTTIKPASLEAPRAAQLASLFAPVSGERR